MNLPWDEVDGGINDFVVLIGGDPPVDLRIFGAPVERRILAHDADKVLVIREIFPDPVQEADRVLFCARKDHVADDLYNALWKEVKSQ